MPLLDKLIDRVRGRPGSDGATAQPSDRDLGPGVDQAPSLGLMDRVRGKILDKFKRDELKVLDKAKDVLKPTLRNDIPGMQFAIRRAAATRTLLLLQYNGVYRLCEPYSFRRQDAGREPLFFFYCLLHSGIHGGYLSRIGGMMNTDQPFSPRWTIEIT